MGMGWNAATLASHLIMVIAAIVLLYRLTVVHPMPNVAARLWTSSRAQWAVWALATAFLVERLYYVVARYAINLGVDFWAAHPVPELLAIMLASALVGLSWTIERVAGGGRSAWWKLSDAAFLLAFWAWVTVSVW